MTFKVERALRTEEEEEEEEEENFHSLTPAQRDQLRREKEQKRLERLRE